MKNNKGFTLTEILLAAMIVGVIGVALAGLTTAAVRESGLARTRSVLRQQLSTALRQLRQDIQQSSAVEIHGTTTMTLTQAYEFGPEQELPSDNKIVYQFTGGSDAGAGRGTTGGSITRNNELWLGNVKSISDTIGTFKSPRFRLIGYTSADDFTDVNSMLQVQIIVEVPTNPVVNETVDEIFMLPNGFASKRTD